MNVENTAAEPTDPAVPSVADRAQAAGLSPDRVRAHLENRVLLLDGQVVDDLDQPAPPGSRITIAGS